MYEMKNFRSCIENPLGTGIIIDTTVVSRTFERSKVVRNFRVNLLTGI